MSVLLLLKKKCCCGPKNKPCSPSAVASIRLVFSGLVSCGCIDFGPGNGSAQLIGDPNLDITLTPETMVSAVDDWQITSVGNLQIQKKLPLVIRYYSSNDCTGSYSTVSLYVRVAWSAAGFYVGIEDFTNTYAFQGRRTTGPTADMAQLPLSNLNPICGSVFPDEFFATGGQVQAFVECCTKSMCERYCPEGSESSTVTITLDDVSAEVDGTYVLTKVPGQCRWTYSSGSISITVTGDADTSSIDVQYGGQGSFRSSGGCLKTGTAYTNLETFNAEFPTGTAVFSIGC